MLVDAARGGARAAVGAALVLIAPLVLGLLTPDVLASSGDAVPRWRLWVWLFETSVYLWALYAGLSHFGIGLAAMVGVRVPENFRRPWAATSVDDFWRRSLVTVTSRFRRLVGRPIRRRLGGPIAIFATLLAGALWTGCASFALYGAIGSRAGAWAGLVLWAATHTAGVLAGRRLQDGPTRMLGWTTTHLLVALAWVPLVAFPFGTLGTIVRIYARLFGFR
jgi:D-alanyl-lipoteichoic acid acyltransferase DltB (MBOAT superfamily)